MDSASAPRDALGRIVTRIETTPSGSAIWQYQYDLRGRLEEVFKNSASVERFAYDPNGNRTSRITPTETWTGAYDDQDRLLSYGPYTYTYTPNGELWTKTDTTTSASTTYTYDVRGNLVRVDLPDGSVIEYLIDGHDRRVGKKRNGVLEKQWLYKDQLRIAAELDGAGALVSRFVYASRENVPDFVIRGGVTYRVFSDHLGSPRVAVNVANASDRPLELEYAAFGAVSGTGTGWMPHGFAGGLYDADTGLVRFGARDYDPVTGRWTSKDPIRFRGGDTNLYAYVQNDPVNRYDPAGREPVNLPPGAFDWLWDPFFDLWDAYRDMRDANTINADRYFHCLGHCRAAEHGSYGNDVSDLVGEGRELFDEYVKGDSPKECDMDRLWNELGRDAAGWQECEERCENLRPRGLDPRY